MAFTPSSIDLDCRDRGGTEVKKKVKKMRSTKLARTPSSKPSARRVKTRFDRDHIDSVSDDSSSELGRFEFSQENFREGNESDGASVSSSSHGSTSGTSSSSSEDIGKGGENEIREIPKKSRFNQALTSLSSNAASPPVKVADESPDYLKTTSCFEGKKLHFQGSLHVSESNYSTIDERKSLHYSKSNSSSSSLKSVQTLRKMSSFRTSRILINKSSFKSNRPSVKKCSQVSKESSVNRATCSSTLKDSKFHSHVELYLGERESKKKSVVKVCPYNYCSLHGHHHSSTPQLKRILSKRRCSLKTQKSIKLRSQSSLRVKDPDDIIKLIETSQMGVNRGGPEGDKAITSAAILPVEKEEDSDLSANILTKSRMESFRGSREGNQDANLGEALSGETSLPEKGLEENLNQERNFVVAEQDILETVFKHKESQFDCFCIDSSLSLKPDTGFHELEHADLTGISCEPSNLVKRSTPDYMNEATEDDGVISSASVCQTLEELGEARDEKNGDLATDHESVEQFGSFCSETSSSSKPDMGFHELEHADLTGISCEPFNLVKISTPDDTSEETEDNGVTSSASICQTMEELGAARDGKNGDLATDHESVEQFDCFCIETSSSLKPDMGFHELEHADLTGISCESSNLVKISTPDDMSDETEDNGVISSASVCQTLEELSPARDEKNGDLATDQESVEQFAAVGDSELSTAAGEAYKSQLHQKKHISMWHLIHRHMMSGLDAGAETPRIKGEDDQEKKQVDDPQCFSNSYHNTSIENHNADDKESELHKAYAIQMVREAIEKILLPEVQDQSSDDQSISSDVSSEQELLEKNHGEIGKLTISNPTADEISSPEQEVSVSEEGGKVEKKKPKSWSNLKKLILLKRFIKALEKVRKFNPEKPQHLPTLEPDPETEKVGLKHQMMDRKKSSEEWMLDFALQQVVGELAPTQKRKVAWLIKAFETVVPPSDERQIQVTFPKLKSIRHEGSSTESEMGKGVPDDAIYRDTKVEDTVESNLDNGVKNSVIITGKQSIVCEDRMSNFNSELFEDDSASGAQTMKVDGLSGITGLPLKPFDIVSGCSEEVPTMNSKICREDDPEPNREKLEIGNLTGVADAPPSITKRPTLDDMDEAAAADNTAISSACDWGPMQELPAAKEQKYGDSELKNESIEGFGRFRDSEHDNSRHKAYKTEFDNEKHASMWHLIHQHMVAGLAVEGKTKQLDKENEEHVGDADTLAATESSGSCPGFIASFQNMGMECHDTYSQDVELRKTYAIKLVREAIEKILLPEVQDQSSDDQSITSETMSDQELIETSHCEGGEPSILTSTDSAKDHSMDSNGNMVRDDTALSQEGTGFATANISESENEETASKVQNKTDKQTYKGWSNLKKWILLKRFIRELEKVKRFNPQKPQNLPLKPDPEAEEVCLRHQMIDERKSAEEWMLDYAIRKVVSELAPKQKRKVALLVKAFETMAPPSEEPQIQVTFPKFKDADSESCCSESGQGKFVSQGTEADIKFKDVVSSKLDNGNINSTISDKKSDVTMDEEDHQEVHKDRVSSYRSELLKGGSESTSKNIHLDCLGYENVEPSYVPGTAAPDGNSEPTVTYNVASSASTCDSLEQLIAAKEKKNGDCDIDCKVKVAYKTQFHKQKYISMWHILCQHVVSGIATKVETRLLDGDDKDDEVDSAKTLLQKGTGSCHEADHDTGKEDFDSSSEKTGLSQRDALKLVKEAIEEILLPEIQDDSSDTQSIASDIILEEEFLEKNHGDVGESTITSIDSPKDSCRECEKSEVEGNNRINQEEKEFAAKKIPPTDGLQRSRNWSKVKKLVLLKGSIKALEKARSSNLRAPKNLIAKPKSEKEKVALKHQLKDEKKKAEEWMLDYAVQHIVSTLTPARKRRVSLLVEAFEAIVPLPEI